MHTNKDIYYPGEKVWFKGYVLNGTNHYLSNNSKNLFIFLIDQDGEFRLNKSFPMQNGQSNGVFTIPPDLQNQNLTLLAFPNRVKNFEKPPVFTKKLSVQQTLVPELLIDLEFNKSLMVREDVGGAQVKIKRPDGQLVRNSTVVYKLKAGNNTEERGRVKTDQSGIGRIQFDIPKDTKKF